MPSPLINIGAAVGDGTGEVGPRGWLQKINRLPNADSTINAGSGDYTGTTEAKITAAIAAAVLTGAKYVWLPQSMLPYNASLVTFNSAVRVIREDANALYYDVQAYGAKGDAVQDDTQAIKSAISAANLATSALQSLQGNIVYFPAGKYLFTSTIQLPPAINQGQVTLKGAGMRTTYLFPSGPSTNFSLDGDGNRVCIVYGTLTPDPAGTSTNKTMYCGWEDLSQNGSLISSGSVVAHEIVEMENGWMTNAIIEAFPNASLGLYLRGATVPNGLTSSYGGPHVRKCNFSNVVVATIGSNNLAKSAVIIQNGDENTFTNCSHASTPGMVQAADSIKNTWIQMGRNNVFINCLQSGDITALKSAYDGIVFGPPQNATGAPSGAVLQNQDYGAVIEGFNVCVVNGVDGSGNTHGNIVYGFNPSIYNTAYTDGVASFAIGGGFRVFSGAISPPINYFDGPTANGVTGTFTAAATTPSVANYNVWVTNNSSPTTISQFTNATPGMPFWVRLDANTTIQDSNNGGVDIRCVGRQNIVGAADMWAPFVRLAGITYQVGPALTDTFTVPLNFPTVVTSGIGTGSAVLAATQYRVANVIFQASGLTATGTVDASITSKSLDARALATNGQAIRILARGRQATQAGSFNVKFGATVLGTVTPASGANWEYEATVTRTGAATQLANGRTVQGTTLAIIAAQPAETLSGTVTVDFRGSVTSGGTLSLDYAMIEYVSV